MSTGSLPFTVYIVSGCDRGTTTIYRCFHKQEQLALYNIPSTVREHYHPGEVTLDEALNYDVMILHRVAYDPLIGEVIRQTKAQGKPVLFDVDDLVFEPEPTHHVDGLRHLLPEQLEMYHDGVRRNLQTLLACDAVLTSTELLADFVRRRGKPAFVHRNALSQERIDVAEQALRQKPASSSDKIVIGYSSGTATHDADFREAMPALGQIMRRFPQVELHLLGQIETPSELTGFGERVRHLPLVHTQEVPAVMTAWHINLAPLEQDNPYCRAKSEVKYIEASVLGLPTVASRVDAFQVAITHGKNGFLASNTDEWLTALESLIADEASRWTMGQRAKEDVHRRYSCAARGREFMAILEEIRKPSLSNQPTRSTAVSDIGLEGAPEPALQPSTDVPLAINWVVGEAIKGKAGTMILPG